MRVEMDICDLDRALRQYAPAVDRAQIRLAGKGRTHDRYGFWRYPVVAHQMQQLAVEPCRCAKKRTAQHARTFGNRLEHRRHIGERLVDNAQDVAGRRLPLERLLGLVEEACVLDRDHGLVGESSDQCDLVLGEATGLFLVDREIANQLALLQQRDRDKAAYATEFDRGHAQRLSLRVSGVERVGNMKRHLAFDQTAETGVRLRRKKLTAHHLSIFRWQVSIRRNGESLAVVEEEAAEL